MECDRTREAISARIDGEDSGLPAGAVEAHLADCAACRDWQQRAHAVTRRARVGGPFLDRDLTPVVLAAVPAAPVRRGRTLTQRTALAAVALGQLAITVPLLILGHDHDAGVHAAHELGSFDLALAIAFAVGAIRPALSAGLAWPCGVAAAGLAGTAIVDLISGQTLGADEAQHLVAVLGAALLCWQARTTGRRGTEAAGLAASGAEGGIPPAAERLSPWRADLPPDPPGGGMDAARAAGAPVMTAPGAAGERSRRSGPDEDGSEAVA
jgi:predicted anti-sigma-YlaC factor YlaD